MVMQIVAMPVLWREQFILPANGLDPYCERTPFSLPDAGKSPA